MKASDFDDFLTAIQTPELRALGEIFVRNLIRADNLRYMHLHLIYPRIMERREIEVMTQIFRERAVPRSIGADSRFTPEFRAEVARRLFGDEEELVMYLANGAREFKDGLVAHDPQFGVWLRALEHSAAMALWSAFESLASDAWTDAVNSRPSLFAKK